MRMFLMLRILNTTIQVKHKVQICVKVIGVVIRMRFPSVAGL